MSQLSTVPFNSFSTREQEVITAALTVRKNAQAPYSNYFVGAAVLTDNNEIYAGCNVERCSYTQTTHAEQNAIDSMVTHAGPAKIVMVVAAAAPKGKDIDVTRSQSNASTTPAYYCGHCRQIIWENSYHDTSVKCVLVGPDGAIYVTTIGNLLPFPFGPAELGITYGSK